MAFGESAEGSGLEKLRTGLATHGATLTGSAAVAIHLRHLSRRRIISRQKIDRPAKEGGGSGLGFPNSKLENY